MTNIARCRVALVSVGLVLGVASVASARQGDPGVHEIEVQLIGPAELQARGLCRGLAPPAVTNTTTPATTIDADEGLPEDIEIVYEYPEARSGRALSTWILAVLALALCGAVLGRIGAIRRPLQASAYAMQSNLLLITLLLSGPLLPQIVVLHALHAEREVMSSLVLTLALTGAGLAACMLMARRRLVAQLRWAQVGSLATVGDGEAVAAEVEPRGLVTPPGSEGPTPWFMADLSVSSDAGPARIALDGLVVDEPTARVLMSMAVGRPDRTRMTVLGHARRVPADASSAPPLAREAPTQPRLSSTDDGPAVLVMGSLAELAARLRHECAMIGGALAISIGFALLTLLF